MLENLILRYPMLALCENDIKCALKAVIECYEKGGKLLLCGNGGSSADCDHITGELMKGFFCKRPLSEEKKLMMRKNCHEIDAQILDKLQSGLPALSLPSMTALNTAFSNDVDSSLVYAQSLLALANEADVLIAISTSGNAQNVTFAAMTAKALGVKVIGLTGESGGRLFDLADICIRVPGSETYKIQELHLPVYHYLCAEVEKHFFA